MNTWFSGYRLAVWVTTLYVMIFATLCALESIQLAIPMTLFTFFPFFMGWMVYKVLTTQEQPKGRFDEGDWYEDYHVQHS